MTQAFTPSFTTDEPRRTIGRRHLHGAPMVPAVSRRIAGAARRLVLPLLADLRGGPLVLRLPDGSRRTFGDGDAPVTVTVRDEVLFARLLTRPRLAVGEGYTAGEWSTDDLPRALELLHGLVEQTRQRRPWSGLLALQERRPRLHAPRVLDLGHARDDIAYHYDLGNELYELFLDETMTYSCAYVEHVGQPLADAQRAKFERLCRRVDLGPDDHLLEIGCGWGGFAVHAASTTGCRVTAVTLSAEQATYVRTRVAEAGLADRIEVVERDYRLVQGRFSKIVSIEMIEAVGHDLPTFFATCDRLLDTDGVIAIQAITKPDQRARRTRNLDDGWIERYIFPGSLIPSITTLTAAATEGSTLVLQDAEEIGIGYAPTLAAWRQRFLANREAVRALGYDERFVRAWEFYLATAEAGFRFRYLRDFHLTFTRIGNRTLPLHPTTGPRF